MPRDADTSPPDAMISTPTAADLEPDPLAPASLPPASPAFLHWVGDLARQHRSRLAAVARHEGLVAEDAVDTVQEAFHTFLTLPAARALTGADDDARRLLVAITRNAARNRRRAHALARPHTADAGVLASLHDEGPPADELLAGAEARLQLASCVRCLGDAQRAVVSLRLLDDVPGEDVARALGISPGHVAVLLHRAKANLTACMLRASSPDTCTT
jgi:RNA polymerase sigma-70 factor, ECF subfamily